MTDTHAFIRIARAIEKHDRRGQHRAADYFRRQLRTLLTKGTR